MSAFSTWEKELHKIVFDPRYLLLTSKERKQVFEQYVKERAEEERREKRNRLREKKDQFRGLMDEAKMHGKYVQQCFISRCTGIMYVLYDCTGTCMFSPSLPAVSCVLYNPFSLLRMEHFLQVDQSINLCTPNSLL